MSHLPAYSHYHLLRLNLTEMRRVYWCHSIGILAASLISIFIPIYLLKIGYSFTDVLVFLLLQNVMSVALQYLVGFSFRWIRPHHLLALGHIALIALFALLMTQPEHQWPLAWLALAWAFNRTIYWPAFHYCFSLARAHAKSGQQIAGLYSLVIFGSTVAPAVGGIIATLFNINYVYILACILTFVAILPMLKANQGPGTVSLRITKQMLHKMRPDMKANVFNGMVVVAELSVWPLFVFLLVDSYAGVGILSSIIAFASILVALYVGRKTDNHYAKRYLRRGLTAYSLTSLGRAVAQNVTQVFGLNLLGGIGRSLYVTPYMDRYYHNSDGPLRLGYIINMEAAFVVGSSLYTLGLLGLSLFFSPEVTLSIALGYVAFAVLGARFIR